MNCPITLPSSKVTITRTGMRIQAGLSLDEWRALAPALGDAARSVGFVVGDWLIYGQQNLFGFVGDTTVPHQKIDTTTYEQALASTGLDRSTLQNYAYVSRSVPYSLRSERLSWEHHRLLAKLPGDSQAHWIEACIAEEDAGRRISTRRLRKSLALGRVATPADLEPDPADKGTLNHIPFVNRIVGWWRRMQDARFLATATREQRDTLKRDLEPVVHIYNQL